MYSWLACATLVRGDGILCLLYWCGLGPSSPASRRFVWRVCALAPPPPLRPLTSTSISVPLMHAMAISSYLCRIFNMSCPSRLEADFPTKDNIQAVASLKFDAPPVRGLLLRALRHTVGVTPTAFKAVNTTYRSGRRMRGETLLYSTGVYGEVAVSLWLTWQGPPRLLVVFAT